MWPRKRKPRPTHELVGPAFASSGATAFGMLSGALLSPGFVALVAATSAAYVLICLAYVAGERSV